MTSSHAEYFLRETLNSHSAGLFDYAKQSYTKYGRGTLFFHFTPVGSEFECGDVTYLDLSKIVNDLSGAFGNTSDILMLRSLVDNYNPTNEFICCLIVSFPNGTYDMKFAKCGSN